MDKYEYKVRSEEITKLIDKERYAEAVKLADTIDWRRVKSASMLLKIAALYRIGRRNEDSREMLMLAYERYPTNRSVVYSLCDLSIELDDVVAAIEYYKKFVKLAPKDNGVYTLRYRILEAQEASLEERIEILEELKKKDYQEEWAYELAYLYHRVGLSTKCVEECDDIILWFGDGPYVMKAMELKAKHVPLTEMQQQNYNIMLGNAGQNYSSGNYDTENYDGGDYGAEAYADPGYASEGYTDENYDAGGYDGQNYNTESYDGQDYETEQNFDVENFAEQGYDTGQNFSTESYDGQGYGAGQDYSAESYDGQGYGEGQNYSAESYDGQNYGTGNYDTQNYNDGNYEAQGYNTAGYNGQGYEESGYDTYGDGYGQENYADGSYGNDYSQEEYSQDQYTGEGYSQQDYPDGQYTADGYSQGGYPEEQYAEDGYGQYADSDYAQNSYVDDGYGNLSYVDDSYPDNGYTSEFYVEQAYDENGNLINPEMYADSSYTQQGGYGYPQAGTSQDAGYPDQASTSQEYRNGLHLVENTAAPNTNSGDMSQYNTINLQKVVAESMKELFPDDNEDVFAEDGEKYNSGAGSGDSAGDTQIFAGVFNTARNKPDESVSAQTTTGRVNIAQMVTGVSETAPEPHTGAIKKVLVPGNDARPIKSDSDMEELRDTTEKSVDEEHTRMEYNDENVYHEQSLTGADETQQAQTGPVKLDNVLAEWERMKQDNARKNQENIKKRVLTQTGKIFTDFDNSIKSGILGELEREEAEAERRNHADSAKKHSDGFLDADITADIPRQPASEDDFDVEYVTDRGQPVRSQAAPKTERSEESAAPQRINSDVYSEETDVANPDMYGEETYAEYPDAYDEEAYADNPNVYGEETYTEETDGYTGETYTENTGVHAKEASVNVQGMHTKKTPANISDTHTKEPYTGNSNVHTAETYVENPNVDTEETYVENPNVDTKEIYVENPDAYGNETRAEDSGGYTEEIYIEETGGYAGETYAENPDAYDGEAYTGETDGYTEETYMEEADEYAGKADAGSQDAYIKEAGTESADSYTEEIYAGDPDMYTEDAYTDGADTYVEETYSDGTYTDGTDPYVEETYADGTDTYAKEAYTEEADEYVEGAYTEKAYARSKNARADSAGEYTEELYTEASNGYTGDTYMENPDAYTDDAYMENADGYTDDAYTENADGYPDDTYIGNSGEYPDTDMQYFSEESGAYTDGFYTEDPYDDLEDAYSEPSDNVRRAERRQNYQYNESDLDPEDAESIAEMAKEDALKTQEIKMNTADLSTLSEKIVATTKKEASGAKREEVRDFTPEEQTLFENFAVTKKIKKQIVYALENMTLAAYTGNVIITGDAGLDTVRMAKNLVKEYQASDEYFSGKLAKITGEKINQRNIKDVFEKLNNGGIIIEKANGMSEEKLYELAINLNQDTLGIVVIMEDTKKEITKLLEKQAMIVDYFNIRIDLMEMDNNALVAYAKNYALALEYSIDELGTLALYTRIANMQSGNHVVTKDEVRDIIDEAIWKSKKSKIKNFVDVLFARRYDNEDMIVLKERDFM